MPATTRTIRLRFLAQPTDANFGGKVHGGTAMKWLDQAGYACATGWSGNYCVTAFVGDINFHRPIAVGDLVEASARVIRTGRTSMHVLVELSSCNPRHCEIAIAVHAVLAFVAVDEEGHPVEVPTWEPETDEDRSLWSYAERIMELRKRNQAELGTILDGRS